MDTEYLRTHLGVCLTDCLAEVSEKRPHDPIEFVSQWLYKYIENRDLAAKQSVENERLKEERDTYNQEQEKLSKIKEEAQKIKQEADEKRKVEEAAEKAAKELAEKQSKDLSQMPGAPSLPPVEEGDEPHDSTPRGDEVKEGEENPPQEGAAENNTQDADGQTAQQEADS